MASYVEVSHSQSIENIAQQQHSAVLRLRAWNTSDLDSELEFSLFLYYRSVCCWRVLFMHIAVYGCTFASAAFSVRLIPPHSFTAVWRLMYECILYTRYIGRDRLVLLGWKEKEFFFFTPKQLTLLRSA